MLGILVAIEKSADTNRTHRTPQKTSHGRSEASDYRYPLPT